MLGVESHSHHHVERSWNHSGSPDRAESKQRRWNELECYRKPNQISMNKAKHNQTMATGSTAPDTTTGTPLQQDDALVAYENLKHKKKCNGRKNGCEMILDIKVVGILCMVATGKS